MHFAVEISIVEELLLYLLLFAKDDVFSSTYIIGIDIRAKNFSSDNETQAF